RTVRRCGTSWPRVAQLAVLPALQRPAHSQIDSCRCGASTRQGTAQVFRSGSSQSEGLDRGGRVLNKGLQDIPALLFGGRDHGTVDDESIGPVFRPKAARDLLLDLHHASVLLRLIVGEGNVWIGQEA